MCRLALFDRNGIDHIESTVGINNLFDHLELSLGGHGNGYFMLFNDGKIRVKKGVKVTNEEITEDILKNYNNIKWVMYHTRLASLGTISNDNCHPFIGKNKDVLMMNGTEYNVKNFIKDNKTDTETILEMCNMLKIDIAQGTKNFNSVFLGYSYRNKKVFANRNNGRLEFLKRDGCFIFASEFLPEQYKNNNIYTVPECWEEDQEIIFTKQKPIAPEKPKKKYKDYFSYYDNEYTEYKNYKFLK